jgi:hypothetical protein
MVVIGLLVWAIGAIGRLNLDRRGTSARVDDPNT